MLMECPADQSALPDVSTLPGRPIVHASETVQFHPNIVTEGYPQ